MNATDEGHRIFELFERSRSHTRYNAHIDHRVRGISDFDSDAREGRSNGAHTEGNDIHRAAFHAASEERREFGSHLFRSDPSIRWTRIFLRFAANDGSCVWAISISLVRSGQVAIGASDGVEFGKSA